jgi:hypothetical protein
MSSLPNGVGLGKEGGATAVPVTNLPIRRPFWEIGRLLAVDDENLPISGDRVSFGRFCMAACPRRGAREARSRCE